MNFTKKQVKRLFKKLELLQSELRYTTTVFRETSTALWFMAIDLDKTTLDEIVRGLAVLEAKIDSTELETDFDGTTLSARRNGSTVFALEIFKVKGYDLSLSACINSLDFKAANVFRFNKDKMEITALESAFHPIPVKKHVFVKVDEDNWQNKETESRITYLDDVMIAWNKKNDVAQRVTLNKGKCGNYTSAMIHDGNGSVLASVNIRKRWIQCTTVMSTRVTRLDDDFNPVKTIAGVNILGNPVDDLMNKLRD